jgi:hypothetical protein
VLLNSTCLGTRYTVLSTQYYALSVSLSLLLTGCGGETGPRCHPVAGKVVYQNQPLAEAMVVFHPLATPKEKFPTGDL